jgi:hypothetical protein
MESKFNLEREFFGWTEMGGCMVSGEKNQLNELNGRAMIIAPGSFLEFLNFESN